MMCADCDYEDTCSINKVIRVDHTEWMLRVLNLNSELFQRNFPQMLQGNNNSNIGIVKPGNHGIWSGKG